MSPATIIIAIMTFTSALHGVSALLSNSNIAVIENITFFNDSPYRLPNTTSPRHYTVRVRPDFTDFQYYGHVIIQIVAHQSGINQIVLNSEDININSITVIYNNINIFESSSVDEYNMLRLNLNTEMIYDSINEAVYTVSIDFTGDLGSDMYGFYRSWYSSGNDSRWLAVTQFAPTSARAAFPCYDEPNYKAVFDIIIERPAAGYKSWSNMRLQTVNLLSNGLEEDIFHSTPVMSTYILAFVVADYISIELNDDQGNLLYEVIARPEAIDNGQGDYAFQVGQELLAAMDSYTGISYASMEPNIKMTQASIPDFAFSAMENWGLLTYREVYLMYDPEHTSSRFQQIIAYILAHEIAHMWFGNLVTCDWWDSVWLNEGFARYFEYLLASMVEEQMGFDTRFVTEQVHTSLFSDSVSSAHPLTDPSVDSPDSVLAHFSTLSYNKGAVVIRMTEHLLGSNVLREGLQNYILDRRFSTAVPSDLFSALDNVAASSGVIYQYGTGFTIDEYYRSWTEKAGYPLLYVLVNHTTGEMVIEQRRFDRDVGYSTISSNWIVPVTFASAGNPDFSDTKPTHIIRDNVSKISRGTIGDKWVIFNKQQTGYYRVNYDDYTWGLITLALRSNDRILIHEYNRAQIVDDVFQLARARLMSYTRAFNILSFLEFETEYAPWAAAITGFNWLRRRFAGTNYVEDLEAMFAGWTSTVMSELTYYPIPNEPWMRSYLRTQLATVLCGINQAPCRAAATAQFNSLRNDGVEVSKDSRPWVYCNALREGAAEDWSYLWDRFINHNVYSEKIVLLENLGCTSDASSISLYLELITADNTLIRPQDYAAALNSAVSGNEINTQIVFAWMQNNIPLLENGFSNLATPLSYISSRLLNENEIQQFEQWAQTNQALLGNSYAAVINNAQATRQLIAWTTSVTADVSSYLENGYQNDLTTTEAPPSATLAPTTALPPVVDAPVIPQDSGATIAVTLPCLTASLLATIVRFFYI